jgi:proline dehydrogenase
MLDAVSKGLFHSLAASSGLKSMASRYGMRRPTSFARRFVAGETVEEAIAAARAVEARGLTQTMDLLGESVDSAGAATAATRAYLGLMDAITEAGIGRNISIKLTQLGLDVDRATCVDNLRRLLDSAQPRDFFVRVDMENSPYTELTLDIVESVWATGMHNVGVVIQSCLRRSEADLARVIGLGARVRLVKGAYKEPAAVAYQQKSEVDAAYLRMMETLLLHGHYPAFATHDPAMLAAVQAFAVAHDIPLARYEIQMLYGIRRDLQTSLAQAGHNVRIYVPFGHEWFPYFMRRLGERPANVLFVVKGIFGEG